ncbi:phosphatase PAP2 family protein [SAR202 cluster bacterium AC-647-N09_OGT_505m]|nr:phosphatase PAP2 family protein [SAR202 cluster bacterium AC-647-N09_OGT_505m]
MWHGRLTYFPGMWTSPNWSPMGHTTAAGGHIPEPHKHTEPVQHLDQRNHRAPRPYWRPVGCVDRVRRNPGQQLSQRPRPTRHSILRLSDVHLAALYTSNRPLVHAIQALGTVYTLVSGISLIYDGRHWLTDVIGGYIYGVFYLLVLIAPYKWARELVPQSEHVKLSSFVPRSLRKLTEYLLRLIG